jgi:transcriptional regulator with XRE-family HTH domain
MLEEKQITFIKGVSPLRQIRERLKLSRETFAMHLGDVTASTIYRWESGVYQPAFTMRQLRNLQNLLTTLDMTIDDLPDELGPLYDPDVSVDEA